ncbi:DUF3870 domain-containing protein [Pseudonocardia kunmingensis]|uniref:Uncharacterized protein DUF3870 n=1 Tax=Pseudonocardia kunmingensis TaxID=630975 RepID=A0A543DZE7_9PSEU|nr:DUF3870 domain-containing protein [Pseudonocardia kunmingensis]TQM14619.1 uncharacterized protein DUF3870 [Pseudonocardia kunmingensis]
MTAVAVASELEVPRRWCDAATMRPRVSLIVVGYAKVPRTSGAHGATDLLAVSLRIDPATGTVVEADSTAVSAMHRAWVNELLLGVDFSADISGVLAEIDESYLSNAAGSLKQAIADAWRRYASHRAR